jgi:outer membrane immunogenic protein
LFPDEFGEIVAMIRSPLLAATALTSSLAGLVPAAQAQDVFDWTGFYVGGTAGIVVTSSAATITYPDTVPALGTGFAFFGNDLYFEGDLVDPGLPTAFALDGAGAGIGLTAGYNLQSGQFVYGLEGDVSVLHGAGGTTAQTSTNGDTTVTVTSSLDNLVTLRARAGVTVDRLLLFATAGVAGGQSTLSTSFDYGDSGKGAQGSGSSSGFAGGLIGGAGVEYAANDNVTIKFDALYYSLQGQSATATGDGQSNGGLDPATLSPYTVSSKPAGIVVRGGVNFRF